MDTSETYIKMCEKAEEIQKLWNPSDGDFCWYDDGGEEYLGNVEFPATTTVVHMAKGISKNYWYNWLWLPRQDQLQEMIRSTLRYRDTEHLLKALNQWDNSEVGYEPFSRVFHSMEQLWLAFVMSERYQKIWDGEQWIKKE